MIRVGQLLNEPTLNAAFMSKVVDNSILGSITTPQSISAGSLSVSGSSSLAGVTATNIDASTLTLTGSIDFSDASKYLINFTGSTNWGIYWDTSTDQIQFHGSGTNRASIDLNDGNLVATGSVYATTYAMSPYFRAEANGNSTEIRGGDGSTSNTANYVDILPYSTSYGLIIREDNATAKWVNLQVDSVARPDKLFITYMQDGTSTAKTGIDIDASGNLGVSGDITVTGNKVTFGSGSTIDNESDTFLKIKGDGVVQVYGTSAATGCFYVDATMLGCKLDSETYLRTIFNIPDGKIGFGPGTGTRDTWLYRDNTNSLKTDGSFSADSLFIGCASSITFDPEGTAVSPQVEIDYPGAAAKEVTGADGVIIRNTGAVTGGASLVLAKSRGTAEQIVVVGDELGAIQFAGADGDEFLIGAAMKAITTAIAANAISVDLAFHTTTSNTAMAAAAERMRITSAGNVGIGTSSPGSYKLNVNGNSNITGTLNVTSTVTATGYTGIRVADLPLKRWRYSKALSGSIAQAVSTALTTIDATWTNTWDANSQVMIIVDGSVNAPTIDYTLGASNTITFTYDIPVGSTLDIIVF